MGDIRPLDPNHLQMIVLAEGPRCPWSAFGWPCLLGYAHGSPHVLRIEAASIPDVEERVRLAKIAERKRLRDAMVELKPKSRHSHLTKPEILAVFD